MTTPDLEIAMRYLTPPMQTFWRWRDEGEVATWPDGRTIIFRRELFQVLRCGATEGLPPLGAVLLLMAATRQSWGRPPSEAGVLTELIQFLNGCGAQLGSSEVLVGVRETTPQWIGEVFQGLDRIRALPSELRTSTAAKAEIVAIVCEGKRTRDRQLDPEAVLRVLERGLPEEIFAPQSPESGKPNFSIAGVVDLLDLLLRDLRCLHAGLPRLDAERLALRLATGLDDLPTAAKHELSPTEQTRALIASLKDDLELSGVARLALNLMAAVHLPRPMADREDLPLGGVSDISNRGALDRLLVSELANDDLTLAVRIAVNEALYLRREAPPRNPPRERFVLLDAGIRMWGVPRVFATAVGLALAATADRNTAVQTFRAAGGAIIPVDFTSRAGLIEHLAALDAAAHPAAALPAFLARMAELEQAVDAVVITGDDVLADPSFARALGQVDKSGLHVGGVDREGRFRLYTARSGRHRPLCDVRMSLDEILPTRGPATPPLIDARRTIAPPAILSIRPFPLRLSHQLDIQRAWAVKGHGVFSLTHDRRLLHWQDGKEGGRQLADDLPTGNLHWAAVAADEGMAHAVVGKLSRLGLYLLSIDLERMQCDVKRLALGADAPRSVASHHGTIFVLFDDHAEAFSRATGAFLGAGKYPKKSHPASGRFVAYESPMSDQLLWSSAMGYDGLQVRFETVLLSHANPVPLIAMFDVYGVDGPVGLSANGERHFTATNTVKPIKHGFSGPIKLLATSRDGLRLVIAGDGAGHQTRHLVFTLSGAIQPVKSAPHFAVEPEIDQTINPRTLRNRFDAIAALDGKAIGLRSRKGAWSKINYHPSHQAIILSPANLGSRQPRAKLFDRNCSDPAVGHSLRAAVWDEGSLAFLDSRGMLHLRSADPAIPEITLVLAVGEISGWISDGSRFGLRYFTGAAEHAAASAVFQDIIQPFVARLPC